VVPRWAVTLAVAAQWGAARAATREEAIQEAAIAVAAVGILVVEAAADFLAAAGAVDSPAVVVAVADVDSRRTDRFERSTSESPAILL
jgi:hypothetical protein